MNRTLIMAIFALLSLSVATAYAAGTAQKQSAETKPATAQPAETKPAATKPAAAQSAATKPAAAQTTETKPASAETAKKPGATKPVAVKPVEETSVLLNAPLFSPLFKDVPIASVDDEVVPLSELNDAFSSFHENEKEDAKVSKVDYKSILDRLINIMLIGTEAQDMGLDDLPEVQDAIKKNADKTLRGMLKDRQTKDLTPDKDLVEKFYKQAVKEWKTKSVIFAQEEPAKKMSDGLKAGKDFDELVKEAIADKTAKGGEEGQYLKAGNLLPQVEGTLEKLKAGEVTPVIKVPGGYTFIKVEEIRYPEGDAAAKKEAEAKALKIKSDDVLQKYFASLKKKYAVINEKLYKRLNYDSTVAKFSKFLKDKRVLIKIKGEKPVTVGQFTEAVDARFFHGVDRAIKEKKVNAQKDLVLNDMLYHKLFLKEARAEGIDKTEEYKNLLSSFKRMYTFGTFIDKVVTPDIKVTEAESKKYYEEHVSDFTSPEMVKLYSLGFYKVKDAADTLKKLQQGDDFKWLKANAPGQIKDDEPGALSFDGSVFTMTGLSEPVKKALTDVKTGDNRLYSDGNFYYVINVREEVPPQKQDYREARDTTAKKVYNKKLNQSVQDWAAKLRKAHKVKVYITGMSTTTE
jgi:PPIC-type PPIASE domain